MAVLERFRDADRSLSPPRFSFLFKPRLSRWALLPPLPLPLRDQGNSGYSSTGPAREIDSLQQQTRIRPSENLRPNGPARRGLRSLLSSGWKIRLRKAPEMRREFRGPAETAK